MKTNLKTTVTPLPQTETEAVTTRAIAAYAAQREAFFATVDANATTKTLGSEAGAAINKAKAPLTWAIVDVCATMGSDNARGDFIRDQSEDISAKLGEKDASARKTLSQLMQAGVTYVAQLSKVDSDTRGKNNACTYANKLHKADVTAADELKAQKEFGRQANVLAAAEMGLDVEDFRDLLEAGNVQAAELKARFVAVLRNGGAFETTVTEGWRAADGGTRARLIRFLLANASDDEKAIAAALVA